MRQHTNTSSAPGQIPATGHPEATTHHPRELEAHNDHSCPPSRRTHIGGYSADLTASSVTNSDRKGGGEGNCRMRAAGQPHTCPGALLRGRCLELDDQLRWYPATVLDVNALRLRPVPDLGAVQPAGTGTGTGPAPAPRRPPRTGSAPGGPNVAREGRTQLLDVPGAQVDLVLRAVQPEPDRALCLTAIDVVDEQRLYPLGHVRAPSR
jgi:hypothetical protein